MKRCIYGTGRRPGVQAAPHYTDRVPAPAPQPGRSRGHCPVFREHPAAAAA